MQLFNIFQLSQFFSFKNLPSPFLSLVDLPNDGFNKEGHINLVMKTCFLIKTKHMETKNNISGDAKIFQILLKHKQYCCLFKILKGLIFPHRALQLLVSVQLP